jgi:signal transduction histidine kinase
MLESLKLKITQRFILSLNLLILFLLLLPLIYLFNYLEKVFLLQVKKQALTVYQQIVITRKWIAEHGGIYVEKLPWVEENPYLQKIGEKTKILTREGRILIKQNPALITRQLSDLARTNNLYWFKLTSLKYINPFNKPDKTEEEALYFFEMNNNLEEFSRIEKINHNYYFRLIKPIKTEKACLKCHYLQGYKEGQIRGAISIFIPLEETFSRISYYKKIFLWLFLIFFLGLNFSVIFLSNRFIFKPLYCIISLLNILKNLYGKGGQISYKSNKIVTNEWQILIESINNFIREINFYQEKMEERIKEVTRALEEKNITLQGLLEKRKFLITHMAHEIKTPLTSIKGSLDFIRHYLGLQKDKLNKEEHERLEEFLEISLKNLKRLIQLFNALIDLEKSEANLLDLEITSFKLKELINEVIESLKGLSLEKNLIFEINVQDDLFIRADREKMGVILSNLLHNAIKFSPLYGTIKIFAYTKEERIRIEVEDQGKGLSEVEIDKVFEKFYKGESTGFGLGLAIAKAYVEAHGGIIGALSRSRGSLFYIEIPHYLDIVKKYGKENTNS